MLKVLGPKQVADHHLRNLEHVGRVLLQLLCEVEVLLLLPRGMLKASVTIYRMCNGQSLGVLCRVIFLSWKMTVRSRVVVKIVTNHITTPRWMQGKLMTIYWMWLYQTTCAFLGGFSFCPGLSGACSWSQVCDTFDMVGAVESQYCFLNVCYWQQEVV